MTIQVKICGLGDAECVDAAVQYGARFLGFVFAPHSRRKIVASEAATLIARVPKSVDTVGLFADPTDDDLVRVLEIAPLKLVQLHGSETPARVAEVKKLTKLPVIKAVGIATPGDVEAARRYESGTNYLLFDAKTSSGGVSGGGGAAFDWTLLNCASFSRPWLLAGGLNADNIEAAVAASHARILDVSSGVEDAAGQKSPKKIRDFLDKARNLLLTKKSVN